MLPPPAVAINEDDSVKENIFLLPGTLFEGSVYDIRKCPNMCLQKKMHF